MTLPTFFSQQYQYDFGQLEQCLGLDLSCWRNEDLESRHIVQLWKTGNK
jgi:hypothetical protein